MSKEAALLGFIVSVAVAVGGMVAFYLEGRGGAR